MLELTAVQLEPENLVYRMNAASVLTDNKKFSSALGMQANIGYAEVSDKSIVGQVVSMDLVK